MALRTLIGEKLEQERERVLTLQRFEEKRRSEGNFSFVIGIDEVGRGPLCGPVVAAACVLPAHCEILFLNDSKKLSETRREALYEEIREKALAFGIGQADAKRIDEINILNATFEAMREAAVQCLQRLREKESCQEQPFQARDCLVLVDGNKCIPELGLPQECVIKGDGTAASIAAASILAKVTRDRMMTQYDKRYPGYGFAQNKGYGTEEHYKGLRLYGKTPIHRNSFLKKFHGCDPDSAGNCPEEISIPETQSKIKRQNTRETGSRYERIAADFLRSQGYRILVQNYCCRAGELDLVALDGDTLCFVEVKYRKNTDCGMPGEAVDENKRRRIAGAARTYIDRELSFQKKDQSENTANGRPELKSQERKGLCPGAFRFDVVEILERKIRVVRNAFELSL